jgi:tRNA pseudouridine55 synthase
VVAIVRRALGTRRVGHAGTLDPFATGLLVVLAGAGTRLARYLVGLPKAYEGTLRLGVATATDDATGAVLAASDAWQALGDQEVATAMAALSGERDQVPPRFSAKRTGGERAHRLARRGVPVTLAPQRVSVRRFALEGRTGPDVRFRAEVGSGTYVRSLAHELGDALGCGAHLTELRRLTVGDFAVADAVSLESVRTWPRRRSTTQRAPAYAADRRWSPGSPAASPWRSPAPGRSWPWRAPVRAAGSRKSC